MPVNRVPLAGQPNQYDTYRIRAAVSTHWRPATCAEVDCGHHAAGWATVVDTTSELGQDQADYIRAHSGRRYVESQPGPGMIRFEFPPGQACFRAGDHVVPLERDPFFLRHRGVPHLGAVTNTRQFERADQWVDDFATHQTQISKERGL